jgi:DNA-binding Xre family transcriptional regulator
MPVHSNLQVLLAKVNVERAQRGEPTMSLRQLALEIGVAHSVLTNLAADRSGRIDYNTIDKLLTFSSRYLTVNTSDLLAWTPSSEGTAG